MPDREKVVKELVCLPTTVYDGFYQLRITHDLRDKVVKLLKEQEEEMSRISNAYLELVGKVSNFYLKFQGIYIQYILLQERLYLKSLLAFLSF